MATATSVNGASGVVDKAKDASGSVASAARKARGPMIAASAGAAGLAGGLALGSAIAARRRRHPLGATAKALGQLASELSSATRRASATADEVRQVREQLDRVNRRSPVEVLLDGLTHRRGAHKLES